MSKPISKVSNECIRYLGTGSANYVRAKKSSKGMFWTIENGQYILIDARGSSIKESSFASYAELFKFCNKKYSNYTLTT